MLTAALASSLLALLTSAPAPAATTIGANLAVTSAISAPACFPACSLSNATIPQSVTAPGGLTAPHDGVVVRWRIQAGASSAPAALQITRPGGSATRTGVSTSAEAFPPLNATSTHLTRLPILAGDTIGIRLDGAGAFSDPLVDAITLRWTPALVDGGPLRLGTNNAGVLLTVNADIELDADHDGYGDETQDVCPTDATTQGACNPDATPPDTAFKKQAKGESARRKPKFEFISTEPGSTFECKLDKKPYKPCESPIKVKVDEGKHKFLVRAVDPAGNADPSPAKSRFEVSG